MNLRRSIRLQNLFSEAISSYDPLIYVPNKKFSTDPCQLSIECKFIELLHKEYSIKKSPFLNNLTKYQRQCLLEIKQLKVIDSDKNLGPCILTKIEYYDMCLEHLNDSNT